jgi:hypothetical protein
MNVGESYGEPATSQVTQSVQDKNERALYRVQFPVTERPRLITGDRAHEVLDCSEVGIRYRAPSSWEAEVGTPVRGLVRFRRGAEVNVQGFIVRVEDQVIAVRLTEGGIPLAVMLDEQRYLRARYPMLP